MSTLIWSPLLGQPLWLIPSVAILTQPDECPLLDTEKYSSHDREGKKWRPSLKLRISELQISFVEEKQRKKMVAKQISIIPITANLKGPFNVLKLGSDRPVGWSTSPFSARFSSIKLENQFRFTEPTSTVRTGSSELVRLFGWLSR